MCYICAIFSRLLALSLSLWLSYSVLGFWLWQNKLLSGKLIGAYIAINKYINKQKDTRKRAKPHRTHLPPTNTEWNNTWIKAITNFSDRFRLSCDDASFARASGRPRRSWCKLLPHWQGQVFAILLFIFLHIKRSFCSLFKTFVLWLHRFFFILQIHLFCCFESRSFGYGNEEKNIG